MDGLLLAMMDDTGLSILCSSRADKHSFSRVIHILIHDQSVGHLVLIFRLVYTATDTKWKASRLLKETESS